MKENYNLRYIEFYRIESRALKWLLVMVSLVIWFFTLRFMFRSLSFSEIFSSRVSIFNLVRAFIGIALGTSIPLVYLFLKIKTEVWRDRIYIKLLPFSVVLFSMFFKSLAHYEIRKRGSLRKNVRIFPVRKSRGEGVFFTGKKRRVWIGFTRPDRIIQIIDMFLKDMMREIKDVTKKGEPFRRWFENSFFDLIVWYEKGSISGFQLCYHKDNGERALTWYKDKGFTHDRVDAPHRTMYTPILVPDGVFPAEMILKKFKESSKYIDKKVVTIVTEKIKQYKNK
ncbi:MAG: hypothetical protein JW827_12930 [Spirochaetes bacterium]|nr:hypothetical protein [Spirochaetota bacterium]